MATVTPTLTLVSTDAFSHQPINVSVTDSLSVVAPYTDLSRIAAATSGGTELIAATQAVVTYIFLKHTGVLASNGNATENLVTVENATSGEGIATLAAGEFMFLPLKASEGLQVISATAPVFVEYIYFSKA
tara:strand:- start:501 stop:893 length:393 start_codon:yes stop_codon:yes gene_type:complete